MTIPEPDRASLSVSWPSAVLLVGAVLGWVAQLLTGPVPWPTESAALLAAGIKGIEQKLELAPPTTGDIYENAAAKHIPSTLRASTETLRNSKMLREAMGDAVIDHYVRCAEWDQEEFDKAVTDWEIARGFERA